MDINPVIKDQLENGIYQAEMEAEKKPTRENLKKLNDAKEALEEYLSECGAGASLSFKDTAAAFKYLAGQGYKIKQSTFYGHCQKGYRDAAKTILTIPKSAGRYRASDLIAYAKKAGIENTKQCAETDADRLSEEIKRERLRKLKKDNDRAEGNSIDKAEVIEMLSERALLFKVDLEGFWPVIVDMLFDLTDIPAHLKPVMVEKCKNMGREFLDRYSKPTTFMVNSDSITENIKTESGN